MGHPSIHARGKPEKPALIMAGSGDCLTYGELERRSAAGANLMRSHGLVPGDHCALLVENCLGFFEAVYAAQRAGRSIRRSEPIREPARSPTSCATATRGHW